MSLTITQARDDVYGMVKTAIEASSYTDLKIVWDDVEQELADTSQADRGGPDPWLCVEAMHVGGGQTSLGRPSARFTRYGLLRCTIYTPKGLGMSTADEIAQIVLDAFEGQSSPRGVWFRNCRLNERGPDGIWRRTDVLIDFQYNEQK